MIQNHALPKGKIALIGLSVFIKIILCDLGEILSLSLFFAYEDIFQMFSCILSPLFLFPQDSFVGSMPYTLYLPVPHVLNLLINPTPVFPKYFIPTYLLFSEDSVSQSLLRQLMCQKTLRGDWPVTNNYKIIFPFKNE